MKLELLKVSQLPEKYSNYEYNIHFQKNYGLFRFNRKFLRKRKTQLYWEEKRLK